MRRTTKSFSPVLLHGKFKQTKVKTKIINGSPAPVYKGLEAIECLLSIVAFCQKNGIVYSQFERWYKNRHKVKVHAVEIVERDGTIPVQDTKLQDTCDNAVEVSEPQDVRLSKPTLFTIQLKSTNGMYFQQRNIDYNGLKDLVEKLEVLCSR